MRRQFFFVLALGFGLLTTIAASAPRPIPQIIIPAAPAALTTPYPILFVAQVPVPADYTTIGSVFGNQRGDLNSVYRGGDLWIRYNDGTLKNRTQSAGYGNSGFQGVNAIAVRDPALYWDGTKAVFSMLVGASAQQNQYTNYYWQLYEITGLGQSQAPVITKVPNQPANFNNVSPVYGTDDRIIFASDRPRNGALQLYPQLDEYEEAPTVSGLWSLAPASGDLFLLNHAPSGAFTPIVDSFGRVIFTRWDHLQRDQQADSETSGSNCYSGANYGTFNYSDESANSTRLNSRAEIFPEPRSCRNGLLAGTNLEGHTFNDFGPWQINEDGTQEETLNHIGRQELLSYIDKSLTDDPNLVEYYGQYARLNPRSIDNMLEFKEDPAQAGRYFGIDAPEFQTHASGQVISINAAPTLDADQMQITYWTHRETASFTSTPSPNNSGHYRDILPLSNGTLVAAHTAWTDVDANIGTSTSPASHYDFRLKTLKLGTNGYWVPDQTLTNGITTSVNWWSPDVMMSYSGQLWELQPVEVRAHTRPARRAATLPSPEQQVFNNAGVNLATLQAYLEQNNLALIVSRNVTTRDDADHQQPFNLRVAGTNTQTIGATGKIYDVAFLQLFQADLLRGLTFGGSAPRAGRRVLAQFLHDPAALAANPPHSSGPTASIALASDGSLAAFVPARRALTWQLTDANGVGVVRERMWLTFQSGEVRVCTSCHGINEKDQAGNLAPQNQPQALYNLLQYWKGNTNPPAPTATLTRTPTATGTPSPTPCASIPSKPTPLSPAKNTTVSGANVAFDWSNASCTTRYALVVRVGSTSGSTVVTLSKLSASQYTTPLTTNKTYYRRVRACDTMRCSSWSAWWKFKLVP